MPTALTGIDNPSRRHYRQALLHRPRHGRRHRQTAIIGDDVKLYQGVTLGALSLPRDSSGELIPKTKRHPTLDHHVTVYSGADDPGRRDHHRRALVIGANTWITSRWHPIRA